MISFLNLFLLLFLLGIFLSRFLSPLSFKTSELKISGIFIVISLFAFALYVRFSGLDFGLPNFFHPDEARKVKIAHAMIETGDLNPHYFRHPTFLLYATALAGKSVQLITGVIPSLPDLTYLGRSVSAVLGALSVIVVWCIARLLFGNIPALISGFLFAVAPLHVVCSRYIKEDAGMLFFSLCSLYFVIKWHKSDRKSFKFPILAGLFAGFSTSTKYSGVLSAAFFVAFVLPVFVPKFDTGKLSLTQIALIVCTAVVFCIAGFLLISPYVLFDTPRFLKDFMGEKAHMEKGHSVAITAWSQYWMYHFRYSILPGLTPTIALISAVSLGYLFIAGRIEGMIIIGCVLLFYLPAEWVKAKPEPQPERYILPCIPFLCIACGAFLDAFLRTFDKRRKVYTCVALIVTAIALFVPARHSILQAQAIKLDTRLLAREWIINNIPENSNLMIEWKYYAPPLYGLNYKVIDLKSAENRGIQKKLSVETLKSLGVNYLILSGFSFDRYLKPLYRHHPFAKKYKSLLKNLKIEMEFSNSEYSYGFHNPRILILTVPEKNLPNE